MTTDKANITWDKLLQSVVGNGICRYKYGEDKFQISLSGPKFNSDILEAHIDGTVKLFQIMNNQSIEISFDEVYTYEKIMNIIDKILSDNYDYKVESKLKLIKLS